MRPPRSSLLYYSRPDNDAHVCYTTLASVSQSVDLLPLKESTSVQIAVGARFIEFPRHHSDVVPVLGIMGQAGAIPGGNSSTGQYAVPSRRINLATDKATRKLGGVSSHLSLSPRQKG